MAADSGDSVPKTVKIKVDDSEPEEGEDSKNKKKTGKEENKGANRSIESGRRSPKQIGSEAGAEKSKNPGEGVDVNQFHVAREIGAVSMSESDV